MNTFLTSKHTLRQLATPIGLAVLSICSVYYLLGITWGFPVPWSWAADEIVPEMIKDGLAHRFSNGWHTQYPFFHFYLLSVLYAPLSWFYVEQNHPLLLAGRMLSVLMGVGSLAALFLLARRFLSYRWSLFALLIYGLAPQTIYYAKLANLEVPYTFWLLWSLHFSWNVFESHRLRDYLLAAFCACAAIFSKEQVFGFYVLLVPLLWYSRYRSPSVSRWIWDRRMSYSLLLSLVAFAVFENIVFNIEGFRAHLELITGSKYQSFRMFHPSVEGHLGLLLLSLKELLYVMSEPVAVLCLIAVFAAVIGKRNYRWLLLPILSYQLFFVHVVLYSYDRFFLPVAAILSLFAAAALQDGARHFPRGARVLAAAVLLWQLGRGTELDLLMLNDARYEAQQWLDTHTTPDHVVGLFGQRRYLPLFTKYTIRKDISPFPQYLARVRPQPDCILMLYLEPAFWPRKHPAPLLIEGLESGRLGYQRVFRSSSQRFGSYFFNPRYHLGEHQISYSNLAKVSPEIRIYSRGDRCMPRSGD